MVLLSARELDEGISGKVISGIGGSFRRNQHNVKDGFGNTCMELPPFERLISIDLRKKNTQLIKQFKEFIDHEIENHRIARSNGITDYGDDLWEHDDSRKRKEGWDQLRAWKLRKERNSFPDIASRMEVVIFLTI